MPGRPASVATCAYTAGAAALAQAPRPALVVAARDRARSRGSRGGTRRGRRGRSPTGRSRPGRSRFHGPAQRHGRLVEEERRRRAARTARRGRTPRSARRAGRPARSFSASACSSARSAAAAGHEGQRGERPRRQARGSPLRLRAEQVEPEPPREEARDELSLDAVARRRRAAGRTCRARPCPGATVTIPPPMPLFPGRPTS